MIEYIIILVSILLSYVIAKKLLNEKFNLSISEQRGILPSWRNNIQEIKTISFSGYVIYYLIDAEMIYTDKMENITICIKNSSNIKFEIRIQNILEKILIKLKLLNRYKADNILFDDLIYIASDDKNLHSKLEKSKLQEAIISLFTKEKFFSFKTLKLIHTDNEFCLKFILNKDLKKKNISIDKVLNSYGSIFLSIYENIKLKITEPIVSDKSIIMVQRLRFFTIFSFSLSFFLVLSQFDIFKLYPQTVDLTYLFFMGLGITFVFAILVALSVFKYFKYSSLRVDFTFKYFKLVMVSTFFIFIIIIKYLNMILDTSSPIVSELMVKEKKYDYSTKYSYYLVLQDAEFKVDKSFYNTKKVGQTVKVYRKNGYFNISYVEFIK